MTTQTNSSGAVGPTPKQPRRENVEAILPMLPNQQALFLLSEMGQLKDPGFLQVRTTLHGPLDPQRFSRAWDETIARHQGLRTSVHRRTDAEPVLIVWKHSPIDVSYIDWSPQEAEAAPSRMPSFLDADRSRGLDVGSMPTMRVAVMSIADDEHELVWTCHHLFGDGWSATIVLEDVLASYNNGLGHHSGASGLSTPDGLRAYHQWAATSENDATKRYWTDRLAGFTGSPPLLIGDGGQKGDGATSVSSFVTPIPDDLVEAVRSQAAAAAVTPNVFVEAAWATVLAGLFGSDDIVFGATVAGRSAPVAGIERTVGYFSNAVPIRIRIERDESVASWIVRIRDELFAMQPHEHASLGVVHGWSEVPGHQELFDSFLVFENLPAQAATPDHPDALTMTSFRSGVTAAFPLSIAVTLGSHWDIHVSIEQKAGDPASAQVLIDALVASLQMMTEHPDAHVGPLIDSQADAISNLLAPRVAERPRSRGRAPRNQSEHDLVQVWREVLGRDDVSVEDDWFDLGGTSLGAVRLFARINDELGLTMPLNTLLSYPTVEAMANRIASDGADEPPQESLVVPLQPKGSAVPLFAVHGGGGEVLVYRELANRLGPDQPVYGIEPVGLDRTTAPLETVQGMAQRYLEDLRLVQPTGPYRLMGFCFGGNVALEMAALLEDEGEVVDMIVVIDSGLPLEASRAPTTLKRARAVVETRGVRGAGRAAVDRLRDRGRYYWDGSFGGADGKDRLKYHAIAQACRRAFGTWEPRKVEAPIVLLRSTEYRAAEDKDWHLGWDEYTNDFFVETIEGSAHLSMFEAPSVDAMAQRVSSWIR
ncbi:MAG: alpha/beta fold hydrolase [Acidimicrobiia bacterium]